ncbi:unnamed protein product [Victoria cruziana]
MPQLDKFTYFTQFFWSCLILFSFYVPLCNDEDGILGISRILKVRNQLISHQRRGNNILSNDPDSLVDISRKCFSTGVSYMYSYLFKVSKWCDVVELMGKREEKHFDLLNILYLISRSSYGTSSSPKWGITCKNYIMLIHYFGTGVEPGTMVVRYYHANVLIDIILY